MEGILIFVLCVLGLFSWVVVYLVCEFKFLICKGRCENCHNWKCKKFKLKPVFGVNICGEDVPLCSSCGRMIENWHNYCCYCGRGVDWSLDAKR